ncbi:Uncharacterised protein [Mycobacteroides abscessus subsp. abscessus]|nr:Uncharacterised protein [Mycobacteroides abscessus subsp. abscessus]
MSNHDIFRLGLYHLVQWVGIKLSHLKKMEMRKK